MPAREDRDVTELPGCTGLELVRTGIPRVYRGTRQGDGEPISALVYPARVDASTANVFTAQVRALGDVSHPHVAPVLDSGLADGHPYVVSTPDAGTLAEHVNDRLRSPAELAVLGRNLAAGLAAIHSAGLIHGGLTPDAVVFTPDGRPMLSGLTLGLGQHTGHAALSSPRQLYLAPETLRDGTTTPLSDLYALGAVLHTAVSGQPPLAAKLGETAGEHILRVLHEPPARLEVLPDRFAAVIAQLLEKDPANRPRDAEAVAAVLAELQPEPVAAVPALPEKPAEVPATAGLPRPALMNRGRLRTWPPTTPPPTPPPATEETAETGKTPDNPPPPPVQQPVQQPVRQPDEPRPNAGPSHESPPPPTGPTAPPRAEDPPPPEPEAEPEPERSMSWLLVPICLAIVAAALITVLAMASRQDRPDPPPPEAQPTPTRTPAPAPTLAVRLNPPADHGTYVDLSWTGDPDLNYVVVIAQVGKPADTKIVYKRTKYRVPVVPGVQYCFAVQATDGINMSTTEPWPIRDAQCEG
jgi:eukaryotic-like serine/threonine-protein kinase